MLYSPFNRGIVTVSAEAAPGAAQRQHRPACLTERTKVCGVTSPMSQQVAKKRPTDGAGSSHTSLASKKIKSAEVCSRHRQDHIPSGLDASWVCLLGVFHFPGGAKACQQVGQDLAGDHRGGEVGARQVVKVESTLCNLLTV